MWVGRQVQIGSHPSTHVQHMPPSSGKGSSSCSVQGTLKHAAKQLRAAGCWVHHIAALTRPVVADAEHKVGGVAGGRCVVQDALHNPPLAHALAVGRGHSRAG